MSAQPKLGFFVKLLVLDREASGKFYEQLGFVRVGADATFIHVRWEEHGDVLLVNAPTGVRVDGKRGWGVLLSFTSATELTAIAERDGAHRAAQRARSEAVEHARAGGD